jgi:hypothetical protein
MDFIIDGDNDRKLHRRFLEIIAKGSTRGKSYFIKLFRGIEGEVIDRRFSLTDQQIYGNYNLVQNE